ncbi:MAG TPA: tetratricopeptide repeat protein, partial [Verrucomicrobiae bacterium]|nr:tetratricopeptide repeat protein [Verrucomicrobiae bacterium]
LAASLAAFQTAATNLPVSEDQAIARYKLADAQFQLTNYVGAVSNYNVVVEHYAGKGQSGEKLVEPALYQIVRASLAMNDLAAATNAVNKILNWYPNGFETEKSLLLTGQGMALQKNTAGARRLFAEFEQRYPKSSLLPKVWLAIARTYEQEGLWKDAVHQYGDWLNTYTNQHNPERALAEYYQAWANFQAGDETNALAEYGKYVSQFPTNSLAPSAQWWIGDYYFRQGDFVNAEKNYQLVFQKWPDSDLAYQARMMAGRSAVARQSYSDAIGYFTNLTSDLNCPADIKTKAIFAYGDSLMREDSPDATNKYANIEEAIRVFSKINQLNPTNTQAALAYGKIGNCYLQLAVQDPHQYDAATNAYEQVLQIPGVGVAARSEAKVGL